MAHNSVLTLASREFSIKLSSKARRLSVVHVIYPVLDVLVPRHTVQAATKIQLFQTFGKIIVSQLVLQELLLLLVSANPANHLVKIVLDPQVFALIVTVLKEESIYLTQLAIQTVQFSMLTIPIQIRALAV